MNEDLELANALEKVSIALSAISDRMQTFEKCFIELIRVCQAMNRDQIKQQGAIINTHNMLCDLLEKKDD
jgi:hypothetical protein